MNQAPRSGDDQIRWQRQTAALLGNLLVLAARESLPPIAWSADRARQMADGFTQPLSWARCTRPGSTTTRLLPALRPSVLLPALARGRSG
jgi:hypothetical protein